MTTKPIFFDDYYAKYLEVKEYFKYHNMHSTDRDILFEEHNIQNITKQIWPSLNDNTYKEHLELFIAFSYVALSTISSITSLQYIKCLTVYKTGLGIEKEIFIFANKVLYTKGLLYDSTQHHNAPSDLIPVTNGLKLKDKMYYRGTEYIIGIQNIDNIRHSFFRIEYDTLEIFMASVLVPLGQDFNRTEKEKYVLWTSTKKSELLTSMFKAIEHRCEVLDLSLLSTEERQDFLYIIEKIVPNANNIKTKIETALMLNMPVDSLVETLLQNDISASPIELPLINF